MQSCVSVLLQRVARGESRTRAYPRGESDTQRTLALLNKALDETRCGHVTLTGQGRCFI